MVKGGKRPGAGRPRGGKYQEETKLVRIPHSRVGEVLSFLDNGLSYRLPLYGNTVRAGFPAPGDDYVETYLDLNQRYVQHPAATFFLIVAGDSMINAGIHEGDMLIVDRSIEAAHGKIVIAAINGELTVKRLSRLDGQVRLLPENNKYPPIDITDAHDLVIWGVVKHIVKTV